MMPADSSELSPMILHAMIHKNQNVDLTWDSIPAKYDTLLCTVQRQFTYSGAQYDYIYLQPRQ